MEKLLFNLSALEIIALLFISLSVPFLAIRVINFVWKLIAYPLGFGVKWKPGENVWAVITGGTDGIGLEYAKQLASKGYSLLIISRNQEKLDKVMTQLWAEYPQCHQIKTLAVDLSLDDVYDQIRDKLNELDVIDVLVNNVGTFYTYPEYFRKIPNEFNRNCINLNSLSAFKMMSLILPKMEAQKRGIVINVTSAGGAHPVPLAAMYCATKAFTTFLSEALTVECASNGIIMQTVMPNQVKTKLVHKSFENRLIFVTPEACVSSALKSVGIESSTSGHWKHKFLNKCQDLLYKVYGDFIGMHLMFITAKFFRNKCIKSDACNVSAVVSV